jgi:L-iditol 2-dehydrogenase
MKAACFDRVRGVRIEERPMPQPEPSDIILRVDSCGICGTDLLKFRQQSVSDGTVLGHEVVGTVADRGQDVRKFELGDRVVVAHHVPCYQCHYCLRGSLTMCRHFKETNLDPGGFAEYVRVPGSHVEHTAFKVPDSVTDDEAIFMEPLACCVRNMNRLALAANDTVLLVGLGSIGQMMVDLFRNRDCQVFGLDLKEERCKLAVKRGAFACATELNDKFVREIKQLTEERGVDVLLLTAGHMALVNQVLPLVRDGGKINLFASLGGNDESNILEYLYHREISLVPTYSATPDSLEEALQMIEDKSVEVNSLLTDRLPLKDLYDGITRLNNQEAMKILIRP